MFSFVNIYSPLAISREVRTFLAEQLQPLSIDEQREWLSNITSHIQSQGLSTPNVEIAHIELAIKVCLLRMTFLECNYQISRNKINQFQGFDQIPFQQ